MSLSSSALSSSSSSSSAILTLSNKWLSSSSSRPARVSVISCSSSTTTMNATGSRACNFYKLLSLSSEAATMTEIKQAYRSMALRYHPDVCRDTAAKEEWTKLFVQLNAAYETLSNPQLREEYDHNVLGLGRAPAPASVDIIDDDIRLRKSRCEDQKRRSNRSSMRTQRMKHRN